MKKEKIKKTDKSHRGNASQFFIAGELCRRGHSAVVTMGNCPNTDILCSNKEGTKFVHVQVKTFVPKNKTCSVGLKAEKYYGENFFWVLGGIPVQGSSEQFVYYIIPSKVMAENIKKEQEIWYKTPGKKGQQHNYTDMRTITIPPFKKIHPWDTWDISPYLNRWDLIEEKLK